MVQLTNQFHSAPANRDYRLYLLCFLLFAIPLIGQPQGTWQPIAAGPPSARWLHTAVWTGETFIVWGGIDANGTLQNGGGYSPATNAWNPLPTDGAPAARADHGAIWTGTQLIVWGGFDRENIALKNGGIYTPTHRQWHSLPLQNAPEARGGHTAIWTGQELIILGRLERQSITF